MMGAAEWQEIIPVADFENHVPVSVSVGDVTTATLGVDKTHCKAGMSNY